MDVVRLGLEEVLDRLMMLASGFDLLVEALDQALEALPCNVVA
jgi:hypothetical protein